MAWTNFILSLKNLLFNPVGIAGLFLAVGLSTLGASFVKKAFKETEIKKREVFKRKSAFFLILPWFLIILYLTCWIIFEIVKFYNP